MLKTHLSLLVGVAFVFTSGLGAETKLCPIPGPVTPESYTWDFPAEVTDTLSEFEREARMVRTQVDTLQTLARHPGLFSPVSHAYQLTMVREQINWMGEALCRLQEIRRVAAPWQQETIDQLKIRLTALVNDTEAAIEHWNERRGTLDLSHEIYREYLAGMYRQADVLCHCGDITWAEDVMLERR